MHPNGAIAIMDRSKDIIISGGEVCCKNFFGTISYATIIERLVACNRTRYVYDLARRKYLSEVA